LIQLNGFDVVSGIAESRSFVLVGQYKQAMLWLTIINEVPRHKKRKCSTSVIDNQHLTSKLDSGFVFVVDHAALF
jgi:hypothetical protein